MGLFYKSANYCGTILVYITLILVLSGQPSTNSANAATIDQDLDTPSSNDPGEKEHNFSYYLNTNFIKVFTDTGPGSVQTEFSGPGCILGECGSGLGGSSWCSINCQLSGTRCSARQYQPKCCC